MSTVQADFDDLALLPAEEWDHNSHYHDFLLRHVPSPCSESLEIGCGTGAFSRLLAARSDRVLALDLSPNMIRIAEEQSAQYPNLDFRVADVMALDSMGLRLFNERRLIASRKVRDAWARHGLNDSYLTLGQVHDVCNSLLPGAEVRRHLFWRYSVVWKKAA